MDIASDRPGSATTPTEQPERGPVDLAAAGGVGVVLDAEHTCMTLRGVRTIGATTLTSALLGTLRADPRSRAGFLSLVGAPACRPTSTHSHRSSRLPGSGSRGSSCCAAVSTVDD